MTLLGSSTVRRAPKRTQIVEELRRRIVQGEVALGQQLPSRVKLARDFAVSSNTMHGALNVLVKEGFVLSQPSQGTFVAEKPPHLSRYAIVSSPDNSRIWRSFSASLHREIGTLETEAGCRFVFYNNITGHTDTLEYQEILRDIRSHRVAGLLFYGDFPSASGLCDTPVITAPDIPRVILNSDARQDTFAGLPSICTDDRALFDRALDYLRARGRSRIALLEGGRSVAEDVADFEARLARRGMTTRPHWRLDLAVEQAEKVTALLLSLPASERPDALILLSETLIEPVAAAIHSSSAQAGRDVDVVAHCNLRAVGVPSVPVRRIGCDMRLRLRIALDLLGRQNCGEVVPVHTMLQPRFEDEVS